MHSPINSSRFHLCLYLCLTLFLFFYIFGIILTFVLVLLTVCIVLFDVVMFVNQHGLARRLMPEESKRFFLCVRVCE